MHSKGESDVLISHNNERSLEAVCGQCNHHCDGGSTGNSGSSPHSSCYSSSDESSSSERSTNSGNCGFHDHFECCVEFDGGSLPFNEGECDDQTLYLATKLKLECRSLKERFREGRKRIDSNPFFSELTDSISSMMELVDSAVAKLEQQDSLEVQLYTLKQLLRLQKSRSARHVENLIKLKAQMKEVNKDYGELLVEYGAQKTKSNRLVHESFSQTEAVTMVDVGTLVLNVGKSSSVQTEPCVKVETQTDEDMSPLDVSEGRNQSCLVVFDAEEENSSAERPQGQGSEAVAENLSDSELCGVDVPGNCCEEASVVEAEDLEEASAETQGISCLPNERPPSDERPALPDTDCPQPLLGVSTSEHDGVPNPAAPSVSSITWPCNHYKRLCLVKFECCNTFYPCHRCHNNNADCPSRMKLKAIDAKLLKCLSCNKVQNITENSQYCCTCGIEFAKYFCRLCKHLTGVDEKPYHCSKCGICRVRSERSFHCDNCGVCLDVALRGRHVCREGSAHDACCICLEDAFTGCQILPCSHKVHKHCATIMISNGVYKCPVCRESFAHKLQRVQKSETGDFQRECRK